MSAARAKLTGVQRLAVLALIIGLGTHAALNGAPSVDQSRVIVAASGPYRCDQVRTTAISYCQRIRPPFADSSPSGCNHPGCNFSLVSYCVRQEMAQRGCR